MSANAVSILSTFEDCVKTILSGDTLLYIDGAPRGYSVDFKGFSTRAVSEPNSETVIRGPREGFVESVRTNTSLLRRKIKNPSLVIEGLVSGKKTNTDIALVYLDGIVDKSVLKELKRRLSLIQCDSILDSGYIEQFIEDNHHSLFPTVGNTQKPDVAAAKILEGRIAVIVDGSPHILTVPHLFVENLQTSDDYYIRRFMASALRIIRLLAFFVSIFLPAFYLILQVFNQEMVPTEFLITMSASREGVPFPAIFEMLLMLALFEFLKESGLRLPRQVGTAISIVGALIIGETAVSAGLVSTPVVIIVAATALCGFIIPAFNDVTSFYRFIMLILSALFGIFGLALGLIFMVFHLVSLESFTLPYTLPVSPFVKEGMKDFLIRFPLRKNSYIPLSESSRDNIKG